MRRQRSVSALMRAVAPGVSRVLGVAPSGVKALSRRNAAAMPEAMTSSLAKTFNDGLAHGGTVYPVPSTGVMTYSNVDGGRINDGRYTAFKAEVISSLIPQERVFDDPVKTFAYGVEETLLLLVSRFLFLASEGCGWPAHSLHPKARGAFDSVPDPTSPARARLLAWCLFTDRGPSFPGAFRRARRSTTRNSILPSQKITSPLFFDLHAV